MMHFRVALFKCLKVQAWPVWARRIFVLALLPRKQLTDLPFVVRLGSFRVAGNAVNLIDYHLLSRGGFELGLSRLLQDWASHVRETLFLDVGANIGVHTLAMAGQVMRIVAIEPFPVVADRLEATISDNKIKGIRVERVALSDHEGDAFFRLPPKGNLGVGRLISVPEEPNLIRVKEVVGDNLLNDEVCPVGLVKIDVEGFELSVLEGLRNRLIKDRPLLVIEVLTDEVSHRRALLDRLPERYCLLRLVNARRKRYQLESWDGSSGDIVAIPEEKSIFLPCKRMRVF